jgi:hypothetical protein
VKPTSRRFRALGAAVATLVAALLVEALPSCSSMGAPGRHAGGERDGRTTYEHRCGACHMLPVPTSHTVTEWRRIMERMAVEAKLDATDKKKVTDWLISQRKASEHKRTG